MLASYYSFSKYIRDFEEVLMDILSSHFMLLVPVELYCDSALL